MTMLLDDWLMLREQLDLQGYLFYSIGKEIERNYFYLYVYRGIINYLLAFINVIHNNT